MLVEASFTGNVQNWWKSKTYEFREQIRTITKPYQNRKEFYALLIRQYEQLLRNEFI